MNGSTLDHDDQLRIILQGIFRCKGCGRCCVTTDPIILNGDDVQALARHFKIPVSRALKRYVRAHPDLPGQQCMKETEPCQFFDTSRARCRIYEIRPQVCRLYPFLSGEGRARLDCPASLEVLDVAMAARAHLQQTTREDPTAAAIEGNPKLRELFNQYMVARIVGKKEMCRELGAEIRRVMGVPA